MKENIKRMIGYYKPYQGIFWTDLFFAALSAGIALAIPLVVRYVTSTLIYKDKQQILHEVIIIAIVLMLMLAVDFFSRYFIGNYGHIMGAKMEYDMREQLFDHMQKLSFSFYDDAKVGQLMSRITSDLFEITELLHHGPENIILSVFKICGAFIILVNINSYLAIAAFVILPIMFVFAFKLNKRMRNAFKTNRVRIAEINGQIEDSLSGIRVVKSFAAEKVENKKFKIGNKAFLESKSHTYENMGLFQAGVSFFTALIQICVILTGTILIAYSKMDISDLITFLLYIGVFTEPIRTLIDFTEQFQNGYTGFERFIEILNTEPDIVDSPNARELDNVRGDISFDNVSFKYQENQGDVLSKVSLSVPQGEYVALVGSSGAGKTTLCSLIPRFYEVSEGKITIDGIDIKDIKLHSLRSHIGIVQQDVYLFAGTIFDNIAYGKPGATREEVIEAAKCANAHEFIMGFPDGYDTDIGQRGVKLSGGQKQRLSIARVFLKNPEILIFDEATSALDNESEKVVQESLESLAKNRTTFVIAHRLTTIQNAKRILVLTEDGIAEEGTHEELIKNGGVYEKLYNISRV